MKKIANQHKYAIEMRFPSSSRQRREQPGMMEQIISSRPGKAPTQEEYQAIIEAMAAAEPGALNTTELQLLHPDWMGNWKRIFRNPRITIPRRLFASLLYPLMTPAHDNEASGPYYHTAADVVVQPWDSPGALVHELGHAIDFNARPVAKNRLLREGQALLRDVYGLSRILPPMPLWQEHAAWRKGHKAYVRGAAKKGKNIEDVKKVVEDIAYTKYPALGSYWGGMTGTVVGVPLAIALARYVTENTDLDSRAIRWLIAGLTLSGIRGLGILGGALTGMGLRDWRKRVNLEKLEKEYPALLKKYWKDRKDKSDDTAAPQKVEGPKTDRKEQKKQAA